MWIKEKLDLQKDTDYAIAFEFDGEMRYFSHIEVREVPDSDDLIRSEL